jgi:hypothetical protein
MKTRESKEKRKKQELGREVVYNHIGSLKMSVHE